MEAQFRKFRYIVISSFVLVFIEFLAGFGLLFSGLMYREFDSKGAKEMIEFIKENDTKYYEELTNVENFTYMNEFFEFYLKKGNPLLISVGSLILALAGFTAVPLLLMLKAIGIKEEIESEEETSEEK